MKKRISEQEREQAYKDIAAIKDEDIDFSDIPEITAEQWARAVRGRFYRPIKKPVTMRLDADVIEWLKQQGPGYQTKANHLLRVEMFHSLMNQKAPAEKKRAASSRKAPATAKTKTKTKTKTKKRQKTALAG